MVAGLLDRKFDLALISPRFREQSPYPSPFEEELLIVRPSAKRAGSTHFGSLRASEVEGVPFLLYPKRSNVGLVIDRFFKEIGVKPRVLLEADDTEAIKRLAESGFGYSIPPEHALRDRSHFFQKFRIEGHRLDRTLALAKAQTDFPRKLTESIADFLRANLMETV